MLDKSVIESRYYIRIRGKVSGPYDETALLSLARHGHFSRVHEVSEDGVNWFPASRRPYLLGDFSQGLRGLKLPALESALSDSYMDRTFMRRRRRGLSRQARIITAIFMGVAAVFLIVIMMCVVHEAQLSQRIEEKRQAAAERAKEDKIIEERKAVLEKMKADKDGMEEKENGEKETLADKFGVKKNPVEDNHTGH
jgi:hypothetical protein